MLDQTIHFVRTLKCWCLTSGGVQRQLHSCKILLLCCSLCVFSTGYFVQPTIVETSDPTNKLMAEVSWLYHMIVCVCVCVCVYVCVSVFVCVCMCVCV